MSDQTREREAIQRLSAIAGSRLSAAKQHARHASRGGDYAEELASELEHGTCAGVRLEDLLLVLPLARSALSASPQSGPSQALDEHENIALGGPA